MLDFDSRRELRLDVLVLLIKEDGDEEEFKLVGKVPDHFRLACQDSWQLQGLSKRVPVPE